MNKSSVSGKDHLISSLRDKNTTLEKENAVLKERLARAAEAVKDLCDEVNFYSERHEGWKVYEDEQRI